jgi:hypothetical protein
MEAAARSARAKLRSARGDRRGAEADMESALDFARRSSEPQVLLPTLADAALIAATTSGGRDRDRAQRVAELYDEIVEGVGDDVAASFWSAGAALALALTDQSQRFAAVRADGPSRWLGAARLVAAGRHVEAAKELGGMGALPEEALARVLAARQLIGKGDAAGGEAELRRALDFWDRVGATQHAEMAAAMLAKTA